VNDDDLQRADEWDFDRAEVRAPSKSGRAVVSVSLDRDLFERVTSAAEAAGMRTSELIRAALVEKLERAYTPVVRLGARAGETKVGYSIVTEEPGDAATADVALESL
jgi:metal-responsive CopG/Arc/MetJ family transcriptional regulator